MAEAEWECCCRAGRSTAASKYPWGSNWPPRSWSGNFDNAIDGYAGGKGATAAVGSYAPNPWGLYDLGGNVWEWCADAYDGDFCKRDTTDPLKVKESGSSRVLRGASWINGYRGYLRSAYRNINDPTDAYGDNGFRVVRESGSPARSDSGR